MIEKEKLIAYVDSELDSAERAEFETALAADPVLAQEVEKHRQLRAKLARAFAPIAEQAPPQRLVEAARAEPSADVVSFEHARARRRTLAMRYGALAACFFGGLLLGVGVMQRAPSDVATRNGVLVAQGALNDALNTQLASQSSRAAAVRIALSFRAEDGAYCRTFRTQASEGLACREDDAWRIAIAEAAQPVGQFEMAGSSLLMAAVDARIDGDALDADAERAARDRSWRD